MNQSYEQIKWTPSELRQLGEVISRLVIIMQCLRAQDGCPWDIKQTLHTLKPHLIEEAYEVIQAIEDDVAVEHCEELGDLLMQIVFQAHIRREEGHFNLIQVIETLCNKLERRHPHVFNKNASEAGKEHALSVEKALAQWETIKQEERRLKAKSSEQEQKLVSVLSGVPRALPGLIQAQRIGEKAAHAGFDFQNSQEAFQKVQEEFAELVSAQGAEAQFEELGDLLFSLVNYARKMGFQAEEALRASLDKFSKRFKFVENASHGKLKEMTVSEQEALWQQAKRV